MREGVRGGGERSGRRPRRTSQKRAQVGCLFNEFCFVGRGGTGRRMIPPELERTSSKFEPFLVFEPKPQSEPTSACACAIPMVMMNLIRLYSRSLLSHNIYSLLNLRLPHIRSFFCSPLVSFSKGDSDVTANPLERSVRTATKAQYRVTLVSVRSPQRYSTELPLHRTFFPSIVHPFHLYRSLSLRHLPHRNSNSANNGIPPTWYHNPHGWHPDLFRPPSFQTLSKAISNNLRVY